MAHSKLEPLIQKHLFDLLFLVKTHMKDVVQGADAGLAPMQILILRILVAEGQISQAKLVQKLGRNKSQVTRLLHELEKKGLLVKERNQEDGRSFVLSVIEEVKQKVSYIIQREEILMAKMLVGIPQEDVCKLDEMLIMMQENLKGE